MGTRREFKGIAYDLACVYNSRNNDFLGYWAIGQLCLIAKKKKCDVLELNLLDGETNPKSRALSRICAQMKKQLTRQLDIRPNSSEWLTEAKFEIDFNPEYEKRFHYWRSALGNPYTFQLVLKTDIGTMFSVRNGGNCLPHAPQRECRRLEY